MKTLGISDKERLYLVTCKASWFIVFIRGPCFELFTLWKLHVAFLWLVPLSRICSLVPIKYLLVPFTSGCISVDGFFIADLSTVGFSICASGRMSGQSISVLGFWALLGFSKQPPVSPYASIAMVGTRWLRCWTKVHASSQRAKNKLILCWVSCFWWSLKCIKPLFQ